MNSAESYLDDYNTLESTTAYELITKTFDQVNNQRFKDRTIKKNIENIIKLTKELNINQATKPPKNRKYYHLYQFYKNLSETIN